MQQTSACLPSLPRGGAGGGVCNSIYKVVMKHVVVFLLLLLTVVACTDGNNMRRQLQALQERNQADSQMTDLDQAARLCQYFDSHGTPNERMLAHYLLGRTYADLGEAPQALDEYHTAADCADTTAQDCDYRRLAIIYGQIGELFYQQHIPQRASESYWKAHRFSKEAGDPILAAVTYEQRGKCYYLLGDKEKACHVLEEAEIMYLEAGDTLSANTCIGPASYIYIIKGELDKAQNALERYEYHSRLTPQAIASYPNWQLIYIYKGEFFLATKMLDSALFYFQKELQISDNINNRLLAFKGLNKTYTHLGIPDSIAKYATLDAEYSDSNVDMTTSNTLQILQATYDYSHFKEVALQKEKETAEARKNFLISLVAIVAILVTTFLVIAIIRRNNRLAIIRINSKYAMDLMRFSSLSKELRKLQLQNQQNTDRALKAEQELAFIQKSLGEAQNDGKSPAGWKLMDNILEESIVIKFHQLAATGKVASPHDWTELRTAANVYMPGFIQMLSNRLYLPNLEETDICILIKLRFLLSEISILLNIKPSALANKRKRLLKKMFDIDGKATDFDERISTLPTL